MYPPADAESHEGKLLGSTFKQTATRLGILE